MSVILRSVIAGAVMLSLSASAASVHAQIVQQAPETAKPRKATSDYITKELLQSRTFPNAYEAIEALRSNWLRNRNLNPPCGALINPNPPGTGGQTSTTGLGAGGTGMPRDAAGIQVYLDGTRLGGIETLKAIPVVTVYSIRRISGTDAQARFGIGHGDGVVFVATGPDQEVKK